MPRMRLVGGPQNGREIEISRLPDVWEVQIVPASERWTPGTSLVAVISSAYVYHALRMQDREGVWLYVGNDFREMMLRAMNEWSVSFSSAMRALRDMMEQAAPSGWTNPARCTGKKEYPLDNLPPA
jgi:hypothetical protein